MVASSLNLIILRAFTLVWNSEREMRYTQIITVHEPLIYVYKGCQCKVLNTTYYYYAYLLCCILIFFLRIILTFFMACSFEINPTKNTSNQPTACSWCAMTSGTLRDKKKKPHWKVWSNSREIRQKLSPLRSFIDWPYFNILSQRQHSKYKRVTTPWAITYLSCVLLCFIGFEKAMI